MNVDPNDGQSAGQVGEPIQAPAPPGSVDEPMVAPEPAPSHRASSLPGEPIELPTRRLRLWLPWPRR